MGEKRTTAEAVDIVCFWGLGIHCLGAFWTLDVCGIAWVCQRRSAVYTVTDRHCLLLLLVLLLLLLLPMLMLLLTSCVLHNGIAPMSPGDEVVAVPEEIHGVLLGGGGGVCCHTRLPFHVCRIYTYFLCWGGG